MSLASGKWTQDGENKFSWTIYGFEKKMETNVETTTHHVFFSQNVWTCPASRLPPISQLNSLSNFFHLQQLKLSNQFEVFKLS